MHTELCYLEVKTLEQLTDSARSHMARYSGSFSRDSSTWSAYTDRTKPEQHSRRRASLSHLGTPEGALLGAIASLEVLGSSLVLSLRLSYSSPAAQLS